MYFGIIEIFYIEFFFVFWHIVEIGVEDWRGYLRLMLNRY